MLDLCEDVKDVMDFWLDCIVTLTMCLPGMLHPVVLPVHVFSLILYLFNDNYAICN